MLIDRDCHKSHHYALVLAGAQPYYIDAFPLTQYSMYGSLAIRPIKEALLRLKAEGKLDRAKMVVLTNCTFDGHVANVLQTMLECLAIKPDLVFLWDEAWFGFARFSPFLRRRTAMGAAAKIREMMRDPAYRERYAEFKAKVGEIDPDNEALLDTPLLPDPDQVRVRVYETDSVHKSMSALRQGSIVVVADQDFHTIEPMFKEAYFTHTSTSPNLQIIATIDLARRQMELEGYELRAARDPARDRAAPRHQQPSADLEVLPRRHARGDDPGAVPAVRIHGLRRARREHREDDRPPSTATSSSSIPRASRCCAETPATTGRSSRRCSRAITTSRSTRPRATACSLQININNTKSDAAHLIKALADMARAIEKRLDEGGDGGARELRGAREVAGRRRARPARLLALPRRVPGESEQRLERGQHALRVLPRRRSRTRAST